MDKDRGERATIERQRREQRLIREQQQGVDDILAMLLAFSAKSEELDILMLSLTFGNVEVKNCLRNVVTLFHYIEKERAWRKENGRPEGFETLNARKPIGKVERL